MARNRSPEPNTTCAAEAPPPPRPAAHPICAAKAPPPPRPAAHPICVAKAPPPRPVPHRLRRARAQALESAAARSRSQQAGSSAQCNAPREIRVARLYCRRPRPGEASGSEPVLQVCGKPKIQRVLLGASREGGVWLRSAPSVHLGKGRPGRVLSRTGQSQRAGWGQTARGGVWMGRVRRRRARKRRPYGEPINGG